ncbi:MAG: OmpH family outer membrane protein [Candidatus Aminicenantales bacterium]
MKRRRTRLCCLLVLFVAGLFSLALAQENLRIGVVNSQQVLEKSIEGKKAIAQLQEKDRSQQSSLSKLDEEIRQLETKLNTQRLTLTNEAILQLTSDLEKKRTERKRRAEDALRELQDLRLRLFNKVQSELLPIIEQLGKEKNLDIIFDLTQSGAIYFNPAIDLTEEVIKRYDASKSTKK